MKMIILDEEAIVNKTLEEYESYKKGILTRNKNLKKVIKTQKEKIEELIEEKRQAIVLIEKIKSRGNRFRIMDI